jgi:hypothetical protein
VVLVSSDLFKKWLRSLPTVELNALKGGNAAHVRDIHETAHRLRELARLRDDGPISPSRSMKNIFQKVAFWEASIMVVQ